MIRKKLATLIALPHFEVIIMAFIVVNSIILALETSPSAMALAGPALKTADKIILTIFVAELVARMVVDFRGFWRDPWRIFDFLVVGIALVPATGPLAVLRALRILRVLRLLTAVPAMRRVVGGLLRAIPGLGSIIFLIGLIFFVFSVISTKLFAEEFPEWFGSIGESSYTLFQIMTLESWSMGIVRPVMEVYPLAWLLFVPFIVITAFTVLNLFIGVIVDAMQSEHEAEARRDRDRLLDKNEQILVEIASLRQQLDAMQQHAGR